MVLGYFSALNGSEPFQNRNEKSCIILQTIFHEYWNKNHKNITSYAGPKDQHPFFIFIYIFFLYTRKADFNTKKQITIDLLHTLLFLRLCYFIKKRFNVRSSYNLIEPCKVLIISKYKYPNCPDELELSGKWSKDYNFKFKFNFGSWKFTGKHM